MKIFHHFQDTPSAGHLCQKKTLERWEKEVFLPNMRFEVNEYCKNCLKCQEIKITRFKPPLNSIQVGKPWGLVGVDVLEVPASKYGNKYLIVFQDYFSNGRKFMHLMIKKRL